MKKYGVMIKHCDEFTGEINHEVEYIFADRDNAQKLYDAMVKKYGHNNPSTSFYIYGKKEDTDDHKLQELLEKYS